MVFLPAWCEVVAAVRQYDQGTEERLIGGGDGRTRQLSIL